MQESRFSGKVFFTVSVAKFNCSTCVFRKGDLQMSQQCDLLESMNCHVITAVESGETQRSVADAVEVARSANAIDSKTHVMMNILNDKVDHVLPQKLVTNISC